MTGKTERLNLTFDLEVLAKLDILVAASRKQLNGARKRSELLIKLVNEEWDRYLAGQGFTCTKCGQVLPITTDLINTRNIEVKCNNCGTKNKR